MKPAREPADVVGETVDASAAPAVAPEPLAALPPPQPAPTPRPMPASPQGPRIVGPHAGDPHEPGMLAHPMDDAHARIDAENNLILRLNDAMASRNVKEMHALIDQYRKLDGADTDANQAGYVVIADCIEHPGDVSLAAAHQFYDTQRHSPLRRFVRRICFENTN